MWKKFMPQIITVYCDQISEHQRDLSNSCSQRFIPEVITALVCTVDRLRRVCGRLVTDKEAMGRNFDMTGGMVAAEPAYILLAAYGHPDAHEAVRKLTLEAQASGKPLWDLIQRSEELAPYLERMTERQIAMLRDPANYCGLSAEKTEKVCEYWEQALTQN
jgi:adenylosuccinate lyase